jgi:hypothetical protein
MYHRVTWLNLISPLSISRRRWRCRSWGARWPLFYAQASVNFVCDGNSYWIIRGVLGIIIELVIRHTKESSYWRLFGGLPLCCNLVTVDSHHMGCWRRWDIWWSVNIGVKWGGHIVRLRLVTLGSAYNSFGLSTTSLCLLRCNAFTRTVTRKNDYVHDDPGETMTGARTCHGHLWTCVVP